MISVVTSNDNKKNRQLNQIQTSIEQLILELKFGVTFVTLYVLAWQKIRKSVILNKREKPVNDCGTIALRPFNASKKICANGQ